MPQVKNPPPEPPSTASPRRCSRLSDVRTKPPPKIPEQVGAGVLFDGYGRTLLECGSRGVFNPFEGFKFPGGKSIGFEQPIQTVFREVQEETGAYIFTFGAIALYPLHIPVSHYRVSHYFCPVWKNPIREREGQLLFWWPIADLDTIPLSTSARAVLPAVQGMHNLTLAKVWLKPPVYRALTNAFPPTLPENQSSYWRVTAPASWADVDEPEGYPPLLH